MEEENKEAATSLIKEFGLILQKPSTCFRGKQIFNCIYNHVREQVVQLFMSVGSTTVFVDQQVTSCPASMIPARQPRPSQL